MAYHHRFTGWMSRLTNFPTLMAAVLPELQLRWQRSMARWNGDIMLTVDGETCVLRIDGADIHIAEHTDIAAYRLELTPQALVQGVFGYRQLSHLTDISHLPEDVHSVLSILFPLGHTWIPGTDWF